MTKISISDIQALGFGTHSLHRTSGGEQYLEPSQSRVITDNAFGFNHRQTPLAIPMNKDHYGFVFFTRPQLNFQHANLRAARLFAPLLTQTELSYERYIRCTLDPRMITGYSSTTGGSEGASVEGQAIECAMVDNKQAFIPLLTNSIESISGWPDMAAQFFSAPAGVYKEDYSMVDGFSVDYTAYDITASFRNSRGAPIMQMMRLWQHYQGHVVEGSLSPYPDMITENEIDYMTRIYRLVLDPSKSFVTAMACSGVSVPSSLPSGSQFDFNTEKPYNDANAQIPITFRCLGFVDNDDVIIRWFNDAVEIFNPGMRADRRAGSMKKIDYHLLGIFNNRGYPRIDPNTRELQWYIDNDYYTAKLEGLKAFDAALDNVLGIA